jgi:hypothetical protein
VSTHTPGPWKATKDPHGGPSDYCIGMATDEARIDRVAVCGACDAHLIAAAPDLLHAAIWLKDVCNRPSAARTRAEAWRDLDKAIAKATGAE